MTKCRAKKSPSDEAPHAPVREPRRVHRLHARFRFVHDRDAGRQHGSRNGHERLGRLLERRRARHAGFRHARTTRHVRQRAAPVHSAFVVHRHREDVRRSVRRGTNRVRGRVYLATGSTVQGEVQNRRHQLSNDLRERVHHVLEDRRLRQSGNGVYRRGRSLMHRIALVFAFFVACTGKSNDAPPAPADAKTGPCPASLPVDGATCPTGTTLWCTYGDAVLPGCRGSAICSGGHWGVRPPCDAPDPQCPATPPVAGETCSAKFTCGFADSSIGSCNGTKWRFAPKPADACPPVIANAGSSCTSAMTCSYGDFSSFGDLCGYTATCESGYWVWTKCG